jgi:hypothetical protein
MRIVYICPELASSVSSWSSCGKAWTGRYKCDASFSTLLFSRTTKKGFTEARVITIGLYAIGTSTALESNKSLDGNSKASTASGVRVAKRDQAALAK